MAGLLNRLDDHVLGGIVRQLPVHPRPFAIAARAGKRLQRAVEAVREELCEQVCEEHKLESAQGKAAGWKLTDLASYGEAAAALRLLVAGAPLDLRDGANGQTALMLAAQSRTAAHTEIGTALIGLGAQLDKRDDTGKTALMLAAYTGQLEVATALIGAGAGLDLLSPRDGKTALMLAAEIAWGRSEVLEGAAADSALSSGHSEIVTALSMAGARDPRDDQYSGCVVN